MQSLVFLITAVLLIILSMGTTDEVTTEFVPLYYTCSEDGGRYAENSMYLSNLKVLARLLSLNHKHSQIHLWHRRPGA